MDQRTRLLSLTGTRPTNAVRQPRVYFLIPESIIKSCSEVQIWQSSYKKAPGRGWRHLIIGWRGRRQEPDRLLPEKKKKEKGGTSHLLIRRLFYFKLRGINKTLT